MAVGETREHRKLRCDRVWNSVISLQCLTRKDGKRKARALNRGVLVMIVVRLRSYGGMELRQWNSGKSHKMTSAPPKVANAKDPRRGATVLDAESTPSCA